jgi:hypothetical protein
MDLGDRAYDSDSSASTSNRFARAAVVIFVIGFSLELIYLSIAEEPYPAITMPGFGWAGPRQTTRVEVLVPEIVLYYSDSTIERLTDTELFDDVPTGHQDGIASNVLAPLPPEPRSRRAPPGRLEPPTWLFPGYNLARVSRQRSEHIASLKEWLAQRARAIHPSSTPTKCVVHWYKNSALFEPHSSRVELEGRIQELSGTFGVNLDEDAAAPL